MNKTPKEAVLKMSWLEAGMLRGALEKDNAFKKLPRSLQLKFDIIFTQAYLSHATLGKKAVEDIKKFESELKRISFDDTIKAVRRNLKTEKNN